MARMTILILNSISEPTSNSSKVVEFLLKLQEDSKLLAEFDKDPDKVKIEAGITSEEYRNVLKTRNMLKIHQLQIMLPEP
jgi:hypothetical protein